MSRSMRLLAGWAMVVVALGGCASVDTDDKAGPAPVRKAGELPGASSAEPAVSPAAGQTKPGPVTEEDLGGADQGSTAASPVMVRQAQSWLNVLHFDAGPADGKVNARTTEAIRKYQKQRGLPVDGKVTEALRDRLRNEVGNRPAK